MKIKLVVIAGLILSIIACKKDQDPFLITNNTIGHLTKEIKVLQLDSIYKSDSIVKINAKDNYASNYDQIEVYEKNGPLLLLLTPQSNENDHATISNIQIFDSRFKTENGLHLNSTFKEVKQYYEISNIQNTLSSVVISLKDSPVYLTIDKSVLPDSVKNDFGASIQASDIPDDAKFKFFMLGWESN